MKSGHLATKLMLTAIFLAVAVYFGVYVAAFFNDPYTISHAYAYTSENAVTVSGYVVREEEALSGGGELIYCQRAEGERVPVGGTVAQIYSDAQSLARADDLRALEEQMQQLTYARNLTAGAQTTLRLDEDVSQRLIAMRSAMAAGDLTEADEAGFALRTSLLRRSYAAGDGASLDSAIASLQAQIDQLAAQGDAGTTRISAQRGGLFSSLVDGYESVLTPERIQDMTVADYEAIAPSGQTGGVGKLIYGDQWYYIALMDSEDIAHMAIGDTVKLRFQKGLDRDLEMKVSAVSPAQDGRQVVTFTSRQYISLTTLLRHQSAQVIFSSYTGIRVPRSAVRIVSEPVTDEEGNPVLDEDGMQQVQRTTGVYCLWGNTAKFKPVDILWQEEEYLLAVPSQSGLERYTSASTRESRRLRAGDEVITTAVELYDGKVIQ